MELKKMNNLESPVSGTVAKVQDQVKARDLGKDQVSTGPSFASTIASTMEKLNSPQNLSALTNGMTAPADALKFSNHAIERMQSRGINYSPDDLKKLNEAVGKAAAKGSKDTLVLMNDSALIVSVKNNTVVTVMDKNALKENVFTNIDSTIVM